MDSAWPGLRQEPRGLPRAGWWAAATCPVPGPPPSTALVMGAVWLLSAAQDPRERPAGTVTPRTHAIPCGRPRLGSQDTWTASPGGGRLATLSRGNSAHLEGQVGHVRVVGRTGDHLGGTVGRRTLRGWAGHLRVLVSGHSPGGAGAEPSRGPGSGNHQRKSKRTAYNSEQSPLHPLPLVRAAHLPGPEHVPKGKPSGRTPRVTGLPWRPPGESACNAGDQA